MPITVSGTSITFNDATTQTTAFTGGGGTVTSVATGNGLSGGTITTSGTLVVACPTYNTVGSYVQGGWTNNCGGQSLNSGSNYSAGGGNRQIFATTMTANAGPEGSYMGFTRSENISGTWKLMGGSSTGTQPMGSAANGSLFCRVS
jgi:hypothetical protein